MNKKITVSVLSLLMAASMTAGVCLAASAEDETRLYDADKLFSANTAPISYLKDGSVQIGDGDGSAEADKWTNAGEYAFSSSPFSLTFRMNGVPAEGKIKRNYFFLNEENSEKTIWFNVLVLLEGGGYNVKANINIQDQKAIADNYLLATLTAQEVQSESITLTYHPAENAASVSVGESVSNFDLTKAADGSSYQYGEELPAGKLKPALMNTCGGIIISEINGSKFVAPDIEEPFKVKDNLLKDFIATDPAIDTAYTDGGIELGFETGAELTPAAVKSTYAFDDTLEIAFRYHGLQPAAATTNKSTYFTIFDGDDNGKQLVVKLFAYCTSDNEADAQYILHASVFSGAENGGQYFINAENTLQNMKDYANVPVRVRYEAENKKLKVYAGEVYKLVVDLTKKTDGTAADTSVLPAQKMRFNALVQHGGIVLERVNDQNFKFSYGDYDLSYTDNKDFFTVDSTARVSYRNAGVYITNNDRNNMNYAAAYVNDKYTSATGNMILGFHYDALNDFVPSVPLTVQKMIQFEIQDGEGREVTLMPFLYKNGSIYMMHTHVQLKGFAGNYVYQNYYVQFEMSANEAVSEEWWLKYDSVNLKLEIGYPDQYATLDLKKSFNGLNEQPGPSPDLYPNGELKLTQIKVQFGGIYLHRFNNYSFVVENPETPDPVDPSVIEYGLENMTFEHTVSFTPAFDKGGYNDATLSVFYKKENEGEEEYKLLTPQNGVYTAEFDGIGKYDFKYVISFDGVEISTVKTVTYSSTLFDNIASLFLPVSAIVTETADGLKIANADAETNLLAEARGQFTVYGASTVTFRLGNLFTFVPGTQMMKETWIDFSDGKNAVWVKVLAFMSDTTNGNYYAYASIMTYRNGDRGTQQIVRENERLDFNFDITGELDPDLLVEVKYETEKNLVSIGKVGSEARSFDLSAVVVPESYAINLAATYGSSYFTQINGVSFATPEEGYDFPAPVVNEGAIPRVVVEGGEIVLPAQGIAYDFFDRRPEVSVVLTDAKGNVVPLKADGNGMLTTKKIAIGEYRLTVTAVNAREKRVEKSYDIKVIKKDLEPPVMSFAPDAFSAYEQGDRENKFFAKSGSVITLPVPTLSDDSGQEVTLQITVKNPRDITTILSGNTFTAEMIGTYMVEYIATDISGKETRAIYNFVVKIEKEEEPDSPPQKKGCRSAAESALACSGALLAVGLAAVVVLKKKKNGK